VIWFGHIGHPRAFESVDFTHLPILNLCPGHVSILKGAFFAVNRADHDPVKRNNPFDYRGERFIDLFNGQRRADNAADLATANASMATRWAFSWLFCSAPPPTCAR